MEKKLNTILTAEVTGSVMNEKHSYTGLCGLWRLTRACHTTHLEYLDSIKDQHQ